MKAIIPCAGLGTRMMPTSRYLPKELIPVWKKPAICFTIEEAMEAGFDDIVLVLSEAKLPFFKNICEDYPHVRIVIQRKPIGLLNAIITGTEGDASTIGVLLPDEFIPEGMKSLVGSKKNIMVTYIDIDRHKYGMVQMDERSKICLVVEKPEDPCPLEYGIIGRYLFPETFVCSIINKRYNSLNSEKECKYGLAEAINEYCSESTMNELFTFNWRGTRFDMGNHQGWLNACNFEAEKTHR